MAHNGTDLPESASWGARTAALLRTAVLSEYLVLILSALYFCLLLPFDPGLGSRENLQDRAASFLPLAIAATGQTIVLITGGIDLSIPSVMALSSVAGAAVMSTTGGPLASSPLAVPAGIAVMLAIGAAVGGLNGLAVAGARLPPFIATLTSMMFFSGLAIWSTRSRNIGDLPAAFLPLGGSGSSIWWTAGLTALAVLGAAFLLGRTVLGRWLFAVGQNPKAARICGVPVAGVTVSAYILSGILAAAASMVYTARLETGSPVLCREKLLDIVGAAILGGTSLFGGKGKVQWTLFGCLFITLIDNSLDRYNLTYFSILMVKGGVILFAAFLDALRNSLLAPR